MDIDTDLALRLAVFEHVARLRDTRGGVLTAAELNEGLIFQGRRVPIWSQMKGIFRPSILRFPGAALTVFTAYQGPYDDYVDPDESRFVYRYRGTDPDHPDNVAVRLAFELRRPLLYLIGLLPGAYEAIFPCYVTGDNPADLAFYLMTDILGDARVTIAGDPARFEARRVYRTIAAKARLHQQQFRVMVLAAYRHQCAMCRLRHSVLLDAAHILPDSDPRGRAIVPNGLSLCKIHHGAFDAGILGVAPDYRIHLRQDVLDEHDGPMLRHGLQEMHGTLIHTPRERAKKPDQEFLAERFESSGPREVHGLWRGCESPDRNDNRAAVERSVGGPVSRNPSTPVEPPRGLATTPRPGTILPARRPSGAKSLLQPDTPTMAMLRRLAHTGTLLLLAAAPAAAQGTPTFPTDDPALMRIWRLGMDSSQVQRLAQVLLDSVGPRLTASPGYGSAADWVAHMYKSWGIEARKETYGTWRGWRRGASHIDLVQPRVRSLEGTMLAWSPGTNGTTVRAEAIALPKFTDSTAFVKWLPAVKGKIVLVSPPWPTCRPSEDWARWGTPESKARIDSAVAIMHREWSTMTGPDGRPDSTKLYRGTGYTLALGTGTLGIRLEQAGAVGVVSSRTKLGGFPNPFGGDDGRRRRFGGRRQTPGPASARGGGPAASLADRNDPFGGGANGTGGWGVTEIFETYNTVAPAVSLSCEDYGLVFRLAENHQKPVLALELDATPLGEQPTFNVIGMIKGSEKPDEYVALSAHFDSWDGGSGGTDNGTGTLMALEAMRILKAAYPAPKRTILVGHWASEEQGLNGSRAFAEDHPEVMKGLQALFNQDNGTGRVQTISGAGLSDMGRHLKAWYGKLPSFYTDSLSPNVVAWSFNDVPTGNPGGTDGAVFACYGTPSFGFRALSWNYGTYTWHTGRDTYDKVVFDDLKHNATLAAMMAYLASEDPEFIARDRSPGEWPENWPANCGKAPRKTRPRL